MNHKFYCGMLCVPVNKYYKKEGMGYESDF